MYWVSILPKFSVGISSAFSSLAGVVTLTGVFVSVTTSGAAASSGTAAFFDSTALSSVFNAFGNAAIFGFGSSKSILPTGFKPLKFTCALIKFVGLESSWSKASSFCACSRMASFSLRFSSKTSCEASFLERSVWNASKRSSYSSCEILAVGRASTKNPFSDRCSTARSNEMFSSRSTLLIRTVFKSVI